MISFKISKADKTLVAIIAARAVKIAKDAGFKYPIADAVMDITACHVNGCKLDLARLAAADDFNIGHDVFGIRRHLDRDDDSATAGQLLNCFLPRYTKRTFTAREKRIGLHLEQRS